MTVQGPVKKPQMDDMSHRVGAAAIKAKCRLAPPGARTCLPFEEGLVVAWTGGWLSTHWVQGEGGGFKDLERWGALLMLPGGGLGRNCVAAGSSGQQAARREDYWAP